MSYLLSSLWGQVLVALGINVALIVAYVTGARIYSYVRIEHWPALASKPMSPALRRHILWGLGACAAIFYVAHSGVRRGSLTGLAVITVLAALAVLVSGLGRIYLGGAGRYHLVAVILAGAVFAWRLGGTVQALGASLSLDEAQGSAGTSSAQGAARGGAAQPTGSFETRLNAEVVATSGDMVQLVAPVVGLPGPRVAAERLGLILQSAQLGTPTPSGASAAIRGIAAVFDGVSGSAVLTGPVLGVVHPTTGTQLLLQLRGVGQGASTPLELAVDLPANLPGPGAKVPLTLAGRPATAAELASEGGSGLGNAYSGPAAGSSAAGSGGSAYASPPPQSGC